MKTQDCRVRGARIADVWARWFVFYGGLVSCPCSACAVIVATQINFDIARRIAAREMVLS